MSQKKTILFIDDEPALGDIVRTALSREGYNVLCAESGRKGMEIFQHQTIDLVILDIMMPEIDGFTVCEWLRRRSSVPIVMLTALGNVPDIVRGFQTGADDYITKPFTIKELVVRIEAIFRRVSWDVQRVPEKVIVIGDIAIDAEARRVTVRGQDVRLTPMEFELLYYLMSHAGQILDKGTIFRDVWGYETTEGDNLVEVGIKRLRDKIEKKSAKSNYITTIRGFGYRFAEAAPEG